MRYVFSYGVCGRLARLYVTASVVDLMIVLIETHTVYEDKQHHGAGVSGKAYRFRSIAVVNLARRCNLLPAWGKQAAAPPDIGARADG